MTRRHQQQRWLYFLAYPRRSIMLDRLLQLLYQTKISFTPRWDNMNKISFDLISTVHIAIQWTMWMRLDRFGADHHETGNGRSNRIIIGNWRLGRRRRRRATCWFESTVNWDHLHFHRDRDWDCSEEWEPNLFRPIAHLSLGCFGASLWEDWVWRLWQYESTAAGELEQTRNGLNCEWKS